jgi:hypothetical protein
MHYSINRPVGKGQSMERCSLEPRTNFFPFKKSPKTECGLDSIKCGMYIEMMAGEYLHHI